MKYISPYPLIQIKVFCFSKCKSDPKFKLGVLKENRIETWRG